jgi:hypothetical protein
LGGCGWPATGDFLEQAHPEGENVRAKIGRFDGWLRGQQYYEGVPITAPIRVSGRLSPLSLAETSSSLDPKSSTFATPSVVVITFQIAIHDPGDVRPRQCPRPLDGRNRSGMNVVIDCGNGAAKLWPLSLITSTRSPVPIGRRNRDPVINSLYAARRHALRRVLRLDLDQQPGVFVISSDPAASLSKYRHCDRRNSGIFS